MAGNFFNRTRTSFSTPRAQTPPSSSRASSSSNSFNFSDFELPNINLGSFLSQSFCQQKFPSNLSSIFKNENFQSKLVICENCGTKLSFLKRKKTCADCCMDYCHNCFPRDNYQINGQRRNRCRRCRILSMQPLDKEALMSLRIRDLKWYLDKNKMSYRYCKEKNDLVDVILGVSTHRPGHPGSVRNTTDETSSSESLESSNQDDASSWEFIDPDSASISNSRADSQPAAHSSNTNNESTTIPKENTPLNSDENSSDFRPFNIADIESEEKIHELTVRQIKLLLTRNFVDFKGCCEKEELLNKAIRLWRDVHKKDKQDVGELDDSNSCKICMEKPLNCVLLDCGHVVTCIDCGKRVSDCPICRQFVIKVVRIFKS